MRRIGHAIMNGIDFDEKKSLKLGNIIHIICSKIDFAL